MNFQRTMIMFVAALILGLAGLFVLVRYLERTAVFFPGREVIAYPSQIGLPYEDLFLTTSDGIRINAWFVKNPSARSTVIFAHGNAGTMGDRLLKVKYFYDLGLNVLIFDYRGYGKSDGVPSEKGIYLDAQAAFDYLRTRADVDMARIIVYGASLGGVAAVDLAVHRPVAALIVDSTITSAKDAARRFYPYVPAFFLDLKFDNISKVKAITCPKLFMHSPEDTVVPFEMGRRLFEAAAAPKEFLQSSGGHNEIQIVSDKRTGEGLKQFLMARGLL